MYQNKDILHFVWTTQILLEYGKENDTSFRIRTFFKRRIGIKKWKAVKQAFYKPSKTKNQPNFCLYFHIVFNLDVYFLKNFTSLGFITFSQ